MVYVPDLNIVNATTGTSVSALGIDATGKVIKITGATGSSGTSGVNGTSGSSGINGISGTNGSSGINGTSGTNGSSGINGTSGTNGTNGVNGTSGSSGLSGTNGTNGTNGVNGTSGTNGVSGTNGTSGVNGTSGTSGIGTGSYLPLSGGTVSGDTTFTQKLYLPGTQSGASTTHLTIDPDTFIVTYTTSTGGSGTSGTSGANGTSGLSGVNGTSGTSGVPANAWSSYTVSWTSSGTSPTIGNGTLTGFYTTVGKTVFVRVKLAFGTTTSGGTGDWRFSLPVNAQSTDGIQFACSILDNGNNWYTAIVNGTYTGAVDKSSIITTASPSVAIGSTSPFTWGNLDSLQFNGSYEGV